MRSEQLPLFTTPDRFERLYAEIGTLEKARISRITELDYAHDWRKFSTWCDHMQLAALPASGDTLALFIADMLTRHHKVASVYRYCSGVAYVHRANNCASPLTEYVRAILSGARRLNREPLHRMAPLTLKQLREIAAVLAIEGTDIAQRNRALMIIGFASALRRSNLASLRLEDVAFCAQGFHIHVRREKQDQEGKGRLIAIPFGRNRVSCPVKCLEAWLEHRGRDRGALFTRMDVMRPSRTSHLSKNAIAEIVKECVSKIGLDPARYGPHSLRAGMISEAGQRRVNPLVIAAHTGHRSLNSLQDYFRPLDLFRSNAITQLGL